MGSEQFCLTTQSVGPCFVSIQSLGPYFDCLSMTIQSVGPYFVCLSVTIQSESVGPCVVCLSVTIQSVVHVLSVHP